MLTPKPFVKWAGGKRQLISVLTENMPKTFERYFEPFLGGGALLFHILSMHGGPACRISDLNLDLIQAYVMIRDRLDDLVCALKQHEKSYEANPEPYYYSVRDAVPAGRVERTARLLFLNRTCFNGLYRVNSRGQFNVPFGNYSRPKIVDEENLRAVSRILNSHDISIACHDFGDILNNARKNDFVYFDPPYQPVSRTSSFTSYTRGNFTTKDLHRLHGLCQDLDSEGCKVMLSNSDAGEVADLFSEGRWHINKIPANRAINSDSKGRTGHFELLIKNY